MVKRSVKSINRITIGQINFGTPFMSVSSRHRFLVTRCIRKYATTHTPLKVSFATPSRSILKDSIVGQVDLVTTEGSVGVLANHVPTIFQLSPGVVRFSPASTDLKDSNLLEPHFGNFENFHLISRHH